MRTRSACSATARSADPQAKGKMAIRFVRAMLLLLALPAANASACGFCVEDKIAMAYDHAVVTSALAQKHHVAFFALEGEVSTEASKRRGIEAMANSTPGVDKGSVRLAIDSTALSVAYDPVRTPFAMLERTLSRRLGTARISISVLRIIERPAELKSVSRR